MDISVPNETIDYWTDISGARFNRVFLYLNGATVPNDPNNTDDSLNRFLNRELPNVPAGMDVILGHGESPAQDYAIHNHGQRWRYHPEDETRFPPPSTPQWASATHDVNVNAEQDALLYDPSPIAINCREGAAGTPSIICEGLIGDSLRYQGTTFPYPPVPFVGIDSTFHVRIRMRVGNHEQLQATDSLLRVRVWNSGTKTGTPDLDVGVLANSLKRTPELPLNVPDGYDFLHDNEYGEVLIGSFSRPANGPLGQVYIEVRHLGATDVYVDYIAIDDVGADRLFRGDWDQAMDTRRARVNARAGVAMLKAGDEPEVLQWPLLGYIEKRLSSQVVSSNTPRHTVSWVWWRRGYTGGPYGWRRKEDQLRAMLEQNQPQHAIDTYMLGPYPRWNMMANEDSLWKFQQETVQMLGVLSQRSAAEALRDYFPDKPLWDMVLLSSWNNLQNPSENVREPTNSEIRMQVNLALTYGAKGVWYFLIHFSDPAIAIGLLNAVDHSPRLMNDYGEDKYACVEGINATLAQLGPTLMNLRWQEAVSTHQWGVTQIDANATNLTRNGVFGLFHNRVSLVDVLTSDPVTHTPDALHCRQYVEVGWLQDPSLSANDPGEYLFVTNRRGTMPNPSGLPTGGNRDVALVFNSTTGNQTYAVEDISTGNIDVYRQGSPAYPYYSQTLPPGDGRLLRIDTGRWVSNRTLGDGQSLIVHAGASLGLDDMTLTLNAGSVLIFEGNVTIGPQAHLVLNGGEIHGVNPAFLYIQNSDGLSGVGTLDHVNILFVSGLNLPSNSTIRVHGGGIMAGVSSIAAGDTISFDGSEFIGCDDSQSSQQTLSVLGTLQFIGLGQTYTFASCLSSIIVGGSFESSEGVTLKNLPNLTGYGGSTVHSHGHCDHICRWQFRPNAECNAYGTLSATQTIFEGNPDLSARWAGILVAYDDARLLLDTCDVRDIRVTPSGAAIHLYDATSSENRIRSCHIYRATTDSLIRQGDGVFMQPYFDSGTMGTGSYARILCSTIDSSWWTGVAVVGSDAEIMHTTILGNRVGTSVGYLGQAVLHGDCIREHIGGCGAAVDDAHLMLGEMFNANLQGENRIEENDTTQLLIGPSAYVETSPPGTNGSLQVLDVITHSNTAQQRVWMSPQAYPANLRETWWGVVPDSTQTDYLTSTQNDLFGMASLPPDLLEYRPAFRYDPLGASGTVNCVGEDPIPPPVLRKGNGLPPQASRLEDLTLYARDQNFHEVYRFLTAWVQQSPLPETASRAAGFAFTLERMHARKFPDSVHVCLNRVSAFVQARRVATFAPSVLAELQAVQAKAQLSFGDHLGAETQFIQLRSLYPTSSAARNAVPYLLLLAMARRDSSGLENLISVMEQSSYDSSALAQAYGMRRGYFRALPRATVAKRHARTIAADTLTAADNLLHARCYPNPFNPSVTIAYTLPGGDHVTVCIYTLDGRKVATLADGWQDAGAKHATFDASHSLPSGTYVYTISTTDLRVSGRMQLIR